MSSPASRPVPPAAASQLNLRGAVDLSALKQRQAPPAAAAGNAPRQCVRQAPRPGRGTAGTADAGPARCGSTSRKATSRTSWSSRPQVPVVFALVGRVFAGIRRRAGRAGTRSSRAMAAAWCWARRTSTPSPSSPRPSRCRPSPPPLPCSRASRVPLFQGGADEQQVRALLDELLKVAAANGVIRKPRRRGAALIPNPRRCRRCTRPPSTPSRQGDYAGRRRRLPAGPAGDAGRRRGQGRPGPGGADGPAAAAVRPRTPRRSRSSRPTSRTTSRPSSALRTWTSPAATWRTP